MVSWRPITRLQVSYPRKKERIYKTISSNLRITNHVHSQSSKTGFLTILILVYNLIQTTTVLINSNAIVSGSFRRFGGSTKFGITPCGGLKAGCSKVNLWICSAVMAVTRCMRSQPIVRKD